MAVTCPSRVLDADDAMVAERTSDHVLPLLFLALPFQQTIIYMRTAQTSLIKT